MHSQKEDLGEKVNPEAEVVMEVGDPVNQVDQDQGHPEEAVLEHIHHPPHHRYPSIIMRCLFLTMRLMSKLNNTSILILMKT